MQSAWHMLKVFELKPIVVWHWLTIRKDGGRLVVKVRCYGVSLFLNDAMLWMSQSSVWACVRVGSFIVCVFWLAVWSNPRVPELWSKAYSWLHLIVWSKLRRSFFLCVDKAKFSFLSYTLWDDLVLPKTYEEG